MVEVTVATAAWHFAGIVDLQRRNHVSAVAPATQAREGFVFAQHSPALLQQMAHELPQVVAIADGAVVGYCLAMARSLRAAIPSLVPMFAQFERCQYHGQPLMARRFFVGGQVCVDRAYRGQGLLARLYAGVRVAVPGSYELCVTEIAARNHVSLHAHAAMGFETLATYADDAETWVIVAWDLIGAAVRREEAAAR